MLGLDPGERRIGLASSDPETKIASPLAAVQARTMEDAVVKVLAEIDRLEVEQLVIGLPLRMDGSEGEAARRARRFADRLRLRTGLPIVMWDERLTTSAAGRVLREAGVKRDKRKAAIDSMAAALILQSYLDAEHPSDGADPEP